MTHPGGKNDDDGLPEDGGAPDTDANTNSSAKSNANSSSADATARAARRKQGSDRLRGFAYWCVGIVVGACLAFSSPFLRSWLYPLHLAPQDNVAQLSKFTSVYTSTEHPSFLVSATGGFWCDYRLFKKGTVAALVSPALNMVDDRPGISPKRFKLPDESFAVLQGSQYMVPRDWNQASAVLTLDQPLSPGDYCLWARMRDAPVEQETTPIWFRVSNLGVISKYDGEKAVVQTLDLISRKPRPGVAVKLLHNEDSDNDSDLDFETLGNAVSNADGIAIIPRPKNLDADKWRNLSISAREKEERACDGALQQCNASAWSNRSSGGYEPPFTSTDYRTYLQTDRPIYRLGQRIFFQGTTRLLSIKGLTNPGGNLGLNLHVNDPEGKDLLDTETATDAWGSFSGHFDIPAKGKTGNYDLEFEYPDGASQSFQIPVEQYRRPEYEVSVVPAQPYTVEGAPLKFKIKANYYFGGPVQNALVAYTTQTNLDSEARNKFRQAHQAVGNSWLRYGGFAGQYSPYDLESGESTQGKIITDKNGEALIVVPTGADRAAPHSPYSYPGWERSVTVEADVTDASRKTVHGQGEGLVTSGNFLVLVTPESSVATAGGDVKVAVETISYDGKPVPGQEVSIELSRWKQLFGANWSERSMVKQKLTTGSNGQGHTVFSLPADCQRGDYYLVARTQDTSAHPILDVSSLWVDGPDDVEAEEDGNREPLTVQFDKSSYEPGQTAKALIRAPLKKDESADVLVSIESTKIHQIWRQTLKGPTKVLELPIKAAYMPQMSVSLAFVGPHHHPYSHDKAVPVTPGRLHIALTSDKGTYRPGQTAHYQISVTDASGKPAPGAELALSVADQSVYALASDYARRNGQGNQEDIFDLLYRFDRSDWIFTRFSFTAEEAAVLDPVPFFDGAGFAFLGGMGALQEQEVSYKAARMPVSDLAAGKPVPVAKPMMAAMPRAVHDSLSPMGQDGSAVGGAARVHSPAPIKFMPARTRKDFKELAAWAPLIVADAHGHAAVNVHLPDDLTTWRATAYGIDGLSAGTAEKDVVTTQELIARLSMPRFFTEGDSGFITALVHNYSKLPQTIKLSLSPSSQIQTGESLSRLITVGAGGISRFSWPLTARGAGVADIKLTASGTDYADALEQRLPVRPFGYTAFFIKNGILKGDHDSKQFPIKLPDDAKLAGGSFALTMAPSTIGPVLGNFNSLIQYPYGCTEQTISRLEPSVVAMRLHQKLGAALEASDVEYFKVVYDTAIAKLYDYQHGDSGWGWWKEDDSNPYITAKVLEGFHRLKEAGYEVDESRVEPALTYLTGQAQKIFGANWSRESAIDHAYIEYVLSLYGKRLSGEMTAWHMVNLSRMAPEELSYLTLAFQNLKEKSSAKTVYKRLMELRNDSDDYTDWDHTQPLLKKLGIENWRWDYSYRFTGVESSALALRAVIAMEPENNELLERITRWLVVQHDEDGWNNTKCTAEVFESLLEKELAQHKGTQPDFTASVSADAKMLSQFAFKSLAQPGEKTVNVALKTDLKQIDLQKKGTGWLYYTSVLQYDRPLHADGQLYAKCTPGDLKIARSFYHLVPTAQPAIYKAVPLGANEPVKEGDLVQMRVKVHSPLRVPYVLLEAPLPSGAEIANDVQIEADKQGQADSDKGQFNSAVTEPRDYVPGWSWTHQDVLDDRMAFFATEIGQGDCQFQCVMRMEMPGHFNINPVTLQAMYTKQVRGYSQTAGMTVTPAPRKAR